jgi:hypothetical protein
MRIRVLVVAILVGAVSTAFASQQSRQLVGRWRAQTAPTGYWIIDRYPDGRFAAKLYLDLDYAKPAELLVVWGRWKAKGRTYSDIDDGTTSHSFGFPPKWEGWRITAITSSRFSFLTSDGHDRFEQREPDSRPLLDIPTPAPANAEKKQIIDTIRAKATTIPDWVKRSVPPRPNQTMQPTAGRSGANN